MLLRLGQIGTFLRRWSMPSRFKGAQTFIIISVMCAQIDFESLHQFLSFKLISFGVRGELEKNSKHVHNPSVKSFPLFFSAVRNSQTIALEVDPPTLFLSLPSHCFLCLLPPTDSGGLLSFVSEVVDCEARHLKIELEDDETFPLWRISIARFIVPWKKSPATETSPSSHVAHQLRKPGSSAPLSRAKAICSDSSSSKPSENRCLNNDERFFSVVGVAIRKKRSKSERRLKSSFFPPPPVDDDAPRQIKSLLNWVAFNLKIRKRFEKILARFFLQTFIAFFCSLL